MKVIDSLVEKLCPNGVLYKNLGNVCDYIRGITYNKSQEATASDKDTWKVLRANNITLSTKTLNFDDIKEVASTVKVKDSQHLKKGDILICAGSGSKEHIGKVAYIPENLECTFGGFMAVIRCHQELNSRFLFHILAGDLFSSYLETALNTTTINNLNASIVSGFRIPLPPLPVQQEIVRILDNFTELTAELTAELAARRKQYEHYRDELLTFGDDVPVKKLSEIVYGVKSGTNKNKSGNGSYPVYGSTGIIACTDFYQYSETNLLVARVGANAGYVHIASGQYDVSDNALIIQPKESVNFKYLYYVLQQMNLNTLAVGGGQPLITGGKLKNLDISVPKLNVQNEIVSTLDRFDTLCNDLTSGLPAEIAARQKQYEYYRDKLLTFKELEG